MINPLTAIFLLLALVILFWLTLNDIMNNLFGEIEDEDTRKDL